MRKESEYIRSLQDKLHQLQMENMKLKGLLEKNKISCSETIQQSEHEKREPFDPDQGNRILYHPLTKRDVKVFFARFHGREDVYAKRYENPEKETSAYYRQCENFWSSVCPKTARVKFSCQNCSYQKDRSLTPSDIWKHLNGLDPFARDVIAIYPLLKDNTCRFLVFDFDAHLEKQDESSSWIEEVETMRKICLDNGIDPLVERSRSGKGAHIWIFFKEDLPASLIRKFAFALLKAGAKTVNLKNFRYYDRILPAQDTVPEGGLGNMIALPLQGKALKQGNSAFVDENWNAYRDQWKAFIEKPALTREFVELKLEEFTQESFADYALADARNRIAPWKKVDTFNTDGVDGRMQIVLSDGIYIDTANLSFCVQNQIRSLASISNPVYFKNQATGLSNYQTPRFLYLGADVDGGYIKLPRGLKEKLQDRLEESGISYRIEDERQKGKTIHVSFKGELYPDQERALNTMMEYEDGILHAATAFGKTVVSAALIAKRKVSTLILVNKQTLLDQWEAELDKFLEINDDLPEYTTKSGLIRKRKKHIGRLQSTSDKLGGLVDIAMITSLKKGGKWNERLNSYGMVIVDEAHHAAADNFSEVLQEIQATYLYGVSATPDRNDNLGMLNEMLLGKVRFRFTSKDRANAQKIEHLVYPRYTRLVFLGNDKEMTSNDYFNLIRKDEVRDRQIVDDVIDCIKQGRTPLLLTKFKDHADSIYKRLKNKADHAYILHGDIDKKSRQDVIDYMKKIPDSQSLLLVATGSLIGEGFDFPRLDTLFLVDPISSSVLSEQYAGRLNRDYPQKDRVIIYDYVDHHVPFFVNMYRKRQKTYRQIGYQICSGLVGEKQQAEAIFDFHSYLPIFQKDLLQASQRVVIAERNLTQEKVDELCSILQSRLFLGLQVVILTLNEDAHMTGDSAYWMQLMTKLKAAGIELRTAPEVFGNFAVIDNRIVWYGGIHLLGEADSDESLVRYEDEKLARELIEKQFLQENKEESKKI